MKNKKGQEDIGKILGAILGIFIFFIFAIFIIEIFSSVSNSITKDQCKPIQEQAEQCQINFNSCDYKLNATNNLLENCRENYSILENNTITKGDFEEVKGYFNLTKNEINTLNGKIDNIDRIYNFYTIKNYSFALNIVFGIEFFSFLFLKNELFIVIINWFKKRKKKKEGHLDKESPKNSSPSHQ